MEHQTNIKQEIEAMEESLDKTPLLFIDLDFSLLFGDGFVFPFDGILQEDYLLSDFVLLLLCEVALLFYLFL